MGVKFWAGMGVGWVVKIDCDRAEVMVGGVAVEGVVWVGCVRYPVWVMVRWDVAESR